MPEVCRTLNLSRSAFYAWRQAKTTLREDHDRRLLPEVQRIFHKHRRRYGSRRIVEELRDQGQSCGRRRVAKLMKNQGLRAIQPKSFKPRSTESRHRLGYSPNLLLVNRVGARWEQDDEMWNRAQRWEAEVPS